MTFSLLDQAPRIIPRPSRTSTQVPYASEKLAQREEFRLAINRQAARRHKIAAKRETYPAMFSVVEHRKVQAIYLKSLPLPTIRELNLGCQVDCAREPATDL